MPITKPKNDRRARRVLNSLRAFYDNAKTGQADDLRDAFVDLLADARHCADKFGFDFNDCDRVAEAHYLEERGF